jgi:hypothetical protein
MKLITQVFKGLVAPEIKWVINMRNSIGDFPSKKPGLLRDFLSEFLGSGYNGFPYLSWGITTKIFGGFKSFLPGMKVLSSTFISFCLLFEEFHMRFLGMLLGECHVCLSGIWFN